MTPSYECKWVVSGNSSNKGPFREEGSTSIRRQGAEEREEESLRQQITQGVLDYLNEHQRTPWRPEPRYADITDLKIELGVIELVGV
jgi:hypothetical protein